MSIDSILKSPDESIVAVLGESYLTNFFEGRGMKKSTIVLSNVRLYFKGRLMGSGGGGFLSSEDTFIPIEDVDGVTVSSFRGMIIAAWVMGILGAFILIYSLVGFINEETEYALISLAVGVLLILIAFALKEWGFDRRLVFTYRGTQKGAPAKWYNESEIEEFIKKFVQLSEYIRKYKHAPQPQVFSHNQSQQQTQPIPQSQQQTQPTIDDAAEKLEKLFNLYEKGALTKAEYDEQKSKILNR